MRYIEVFGLLALVCSTVQGTTNGRGSLYPFSIDTQLICHRELKLASGETRYVEEPILRLGYGRRVMQGDNPRVFLPQDTSFRQPSLLGLTDEIEQDLLKFLGEDFNPVLTSVSRPARPAPKACELLPAFEGSAGQLKQHVEVVQEPVPVIDNAINDRDELDTNPTISSLVNLNADELRGTPPIRRDNTTNPRLISLDNFRGFSFRYMEFLNNHTEFCELWIAKCPLTSVWAELPPTFLPRYFAQGTCSGKNCSYPRGLFCEEDFTYSVYVTVLRWDCCYNAFLGQLRWDCGWRKVQIPILCDCTCACGPRFGMMTG